MVILINSSLTAEARVRSRGQSMWDLWWTKWHWDRFFSELSVFPCQFHSTVAPLIVKLGKIKLLIFITGGEQEALRLRCVRSICCGALHPPKKINFCPVPLVIDVLSNLMCRPMYVRGSGRANYGEIIVTFILAYSRVLEARNESDKFWTWTALSCRDSTYKQDCVYTVQIWIDTGLMLLSCSEVPFSKWLRY
jgi:hypothetical protein